MCEERSLFFSGAIVISIASDDAISTGLSLPVWQRCGRKKECILLQHKLEEDRFRWCYFNRFSLLVWQQCVEKGAPDDLELDCFGWLLLLGFVFVFTSSFADILLTSCLNCWIVESVKKKKFHTQSESSFFRLSVKVCVYVCVCMSMHANVCVCVCVNAYPCM